MTSLAPATVAPLGERYYRDNFRFVLTFVEDRYQHFLTGAEQHFCISFARCSVDAQCLYVRLALRRGPLFRTDKLRYTEVSDLAAAIDELLGAGLL